MFLVFIEIHRKLKKWKLMFMVGTWRKNTWRELLATSLSKLMYFLHEGRVTIEIQLMYIFMLIHMIFLLSHGIKTTENEFHYCLKDPK